MVLKCLGVDHVKKVIAIYKSEKGFWAELLKQRLSFSIYSANSFLANQY